MPGSSVWTSLRLGVLRGGTFSWPLAARLYGDPSARHTGDLDLLIPADRVSDACAALETIGYLPSAGTAKLRRRARGLGTDQLIRAIDPL